MVGEVTDMPEVVWCCLRLCLQIVVTGTQEVSRPGRRLGGANDPVDAFLDHLEQYGSAAALPLVSIPGHELGFVFSQGKSKLNCVVACSSCFNETYLR